MAIKLMYSAPVTKVFTIVAEESLLGYSSYYGDPGAPGEDFGEGNDFGGF